ncbi:MAG: MBL fold metallo-hydrolase [Acidimicrobiaceae bacterium]|nr:MBL fold metallo-hydrolase [Acidimicrobiaceae bacterium]MCY4175692.1 MBL fold metallo-hydrolase [Acidimicrobiaceae bacterium]MCY4281046.1 MBL fold metallo-hydrolase [Acidimicrobiaceae bacterium]MCY4293708.1 MBL fold metallo-hydrolase [Acidimicrobiaceae bacterium]
MALTVTVLGCSGSYAAPGNPCTGYLVRSGTTAVLLDCGPGTLGPLQEAIDLADLDAIVITHCHPDHWLELPVIRNVFVWFVPRSDVAVYGTAETRAMDRAVTMLREGRIDPLDWNVIGPASRLSIGDQRWSFALTDHPVETLATRVDSGGRCFAFSADTGPGWDFRSLGEGIDLAMCEASHGRRHEAAGSPHMSARQAAAAAAVAGAERLVLTHLPPGCDPEAQRSEAAGVFAGELEVARPGLVLTV